MSTVITATTSSETTTPLIVHGYQTERQSQNIIHDLISGGIAVTLIAPRPRSGRLELVYEQEADAYAALEMHAAEDTFTLADDDVPSVNMSYVIDGSVSLTLDDETRSLWVLTVGYQEVIL
jgi:hypothetical protein